MSGQEELNVMLQPATVNLNEAFIANLRAVADFLEKNRIDAHFSSPTIYCFALDTADFAMLARQFGAAVKSASGDWFNLDKRFGDGVGEVHLQLTVKREAVCEKVVTQRVVPAEPEKVIPEQVVPAKPERVVEIVDWVCPPSVLSLADQKESLAGAG